MKKQGKGVQLNYALTNLVPYRGGMVSISAALLSYVNKDYFQSFLSLANSISSLLTIGQLSTDYPQGSRQCSQCAAGAGMLAVFKSDDLTYVDKTRVAAALKTS